MAEEEIEKIVGDLLRAKGLTLAVAESSTGGLVGHLLTEVPGSSAYFLGGVVAYANDPKRAILKVEPATLREHGVVSEETTLEMARGVRELFESDIALAVNGIAGPASGRRSKKPIGLTYIALSAADEERCEHHLWQGDRAAIKAQAAKTALALLKRYLER